MNGRERIMRTIVGDPIDRVPVWPFLMSFSARYAEINYSQFATDFRQLVQAQIVTAEAFDIDAIVVDSDAYREAAACGAVVEFPQNAFPHIKQHAIDNKNTFSFKVPDVGGSKRLVDKIEGIRYLNEYYKGDKAIVGWIEAPFQSAGTLYDINDFMTDIFEDSEFVRELLDFTCELGIAFALEQVEAGADIIGVGDAMASMVSAQVYEEFVLPYTKRLVKGIREKSNVKLKYHMCGNATHLLPAIAGLGFDVVNIDHTTDVVEAVRILGNNTCIKGNVDPANVMQFGTAKEVKDACDRLIEMEIPKYILSAGCEIPSNTPHANLEAMVECSKAHRNLFIR